MPTHPLQQSITRRGSAMMATLTLLVVLVAMSTALTDMSIASFQQQVDRRDDLQTMIAAESIANVAYRHIVDNWSDLDPALAQPDGEIALPTAVMDLLPDMPGMELEATIHHISGTTPLDYVFLVRGTAAAGDPSDPENYLRHRVELIASSSLNSTTTTTTTDGISFVHAMYAILGYDFKGSATTDSYDSSLGAYGGGNSGGNKGDLGSNGFINVQKMGNINGASVKEKIGLPPPTVDFDLAYQEAQNEAAAAGKSVTAWGDVSHVASTTPLDLDAAGSPYYMTSLTLDDTAVVNVSGDVKIFVDGPLQMLDALTKYDTTDPDSRLTIVQSDNNGANDISFRINGNDGLGDIATHQADKFLYYTELSKQMTFNGNGAMCGVFVAPNATIKLNGTFDYYGAFIARAFGNNVDTSDPDAMGRVNGNFAFHYDEQLANLNQDTATTTATITTPAPTPVISGWRSFRLGFHFQD